MTKRAEIRMTLTPGQEDFDQEWDDIHATVTLMLDRKEVAQMLLRCAEYMVDSEDTGDDPLQFDLVGRAYMSGRLPTEATHTADGAEAPNIRIVDEIHGWDFERDDFPADDGE